ncbi:MAG: FAD-dependent oxidoreductase [Rhodospirillaceae bacterium]
MPADQTAPATPAAKLGETDVTVIGAGVVGVNCALALVKEGFRVTIVDRLAPGEFCSHGNAGILSVWSFVPIFGPDVLKSVPKWLIDPTGPLTIRWTRLPQILPWLLRMLPKANAAHLKYASDAMHHLTAACADNYAKMAAEAGAPELVRHHPVLQVYDSETDFQKAEKDLQFRATYGIKYDRLYRKALHDLEPELADRFQWGHALLGGGTAANPGRLVKVLAEDFQRRGGKIIRADVRNIRHLQGGGVLIETDGDYIRTDRLVVAAGAFSHRLSQGLGDHFPLGTERGYHAIVADPGVKVSHAVGWKSKAFFATPMEMGLRFAGTVELAGHDAAPNFKRADLVAMHGRAMFPKMTGAVTSKWMGFRPSLPDSMPVVGPSENIPGVYYAFGHQHVGLVCGPQTGRVIADLVAGRRPNFDISPFRAGRF